MSEIKIMSHDEAMEKSSPDDEKTIVQIRMVESLKRSKILPEIFSQPARIGRSIDEGLMNFTILGMLISKNGEKYESFSVQVKDGWYEIDCANQEIHDVVKEIVEKCMDRTSYSKLEGVVTGAKYRHYKGGIYEVLCGHATNTETLEEVVVYRSCDDESRCWVRPRSMFMDGRFQPE